MEEIKDSGSVTIGGREIRTSDARKILRLIRDRKNACQEKLLKIANRIKLLERFEKESSGSKSTLSSWMKSKALNYADFFTSLGYYSPSQNAVSNDAENTILSYHDGMKFNREVGYYLPKKEIVNIADHNEVINSKLGMTYDPKLALYFPTTIYDTDVFESSEQTGDRAMDIMGGFTTKDLGNLNVANDFAKELVSTVIELYQEEFDNVEQELDGVKAIESEILKTDSFSEASGSSQNALCRAKCAFIINKDKKAKCQSDCDEKNPPSDSQEQRRLDREGRGDARTEKRETKEELKEAYKRGEITLREYQAGKRDNRETKRDSIKESGGNALGRGWRVFAKVNPITAVARGGAIILIRNNAFGFATRVAPALVSDDVARTKFKPESVAKAKQAWAKVSHAWRGIGGDVQKLKENILKGWNKKPMKISRKEIREERKSKVVGVDDAVAIASAVISGLSVIAGLISALNKGGADKNPFNRGQEPTGYDESVNDGTMDAPESDPNSPQYDPVSGDWTDPQSGKRIDPTTGAFTDDTILGMNKWLAIGLGIGLTVGVVLLIKKLSKAQ